LVMPVDWYEQAVELLRMHNHGQMPVLQSFQTNGMLLDEHWCAFLRRHQAHIGVSVDGPAFLHDRHRVTRRGRGTLDQALRGIELLHEHEVPFDVITVLTSDSLDYPDELFDFYQAHGIRAVGFNVEEIEGPHTISSLQRAGTPERFRRFFARFVQLAAAADPPLRVREFDTSAAALLWGRCGPDARTQENKPWAIVSVDCDGNFGTWSPELLGQASPDHGRFALGNVATDPFDAVAASERFLRIEGQIARGVAMCRESCTYFPFCGGGAPANKYYENRTFASTETLCCRLHKKVCIDVTLEFLQRQARAAGDVLHADGAAAFGAEHGTP
ncbi:MAG TPA: cyclophane-forming radical SAM/SPASM peptide maturase GrrM/OscB, partial [Tepidisphaeraceae bacterium]